MGTVQKVLLYGGTFDPPHNGHMNNLRAALELVRPDKAIVMPAGIPPHKKASTTPGKVRLAMCQCFTALSPAVEVSDWEIAQGGRSYTVHTLEMLRDAYPGAELYLCVGSDMLLTFTQWSRWQDMLAMAALVVESREAGDEPALQAAAADLTAQGGRVLFARAEAYPCASSDIRSGKFGTSAYPVDMKGDDKMTLQELHDAICGAPVNAGYDPETQSTTESKVGIEFDVAEAQPLWDAASTGDTVTIPATLTQPEMTQERLQKHLLADKLATKTTSLSGSSSNRITNVRLAAEKINGVILQPGQTFSYNDVLGQRTKANGFKEAGAYSGGQVVQEVGGGICQVSSTLYYCAMVSNLKINTRTCHYFPVAYIEPGMDATVSWGGPEFKFTNSREYPIEIKAYVEKNSITVEIWGTDVDGSYVKMSYTANGLRATTYRTVYDKDGNEISRTVEANSTYHSHDTTPKPTPTPSATPTPTPTPKPQPTPYPSVYDPGDAGED